MSEPLDRHPNWAPEVQRAHSESELLGGCDLNKVPVGGLLLVTTRCSKYVIEKLEDGYMISGNKTYCPVPTRCNILGSIYTKLSSMIRTRFIGRGMFMEFNTAEYPRLITSEVVEVIEI